MPEMKRTSSDMPAFRIESSDSNLSPSPHPQPSNTAGNVFTTFMKKVPYNQISPALKRRVTGGSKKDSTGGGGGSGEGSSENQEPPRRSAMSQILHSGADVMKKKFGRGGSGGNLASDGLGWTSDETVDSDDHNMRHGHFSRVLEQIRSKDTPLLWKSGGSETAMGHGDLDIHLAGSDEETDVDGVFSNFFPSLNTVSAIDSEILDTKTKLECYQHKTSELTKQLLQELSNSNSDPNLPSTTVQSYNDSNIKTQKIIRGLQKKLKHLEERKRRIREQDVLKGGGEVQFGAGTEDQGDGLVVRQRTPEKKGNLIAGVYKKAVAKRRKTRPLDEKNWGSDGAIDTSGSGVIELAETISEVVSSENGASSPGTGSNANLSATSNSGGGGLASATTPDPIMELPTNPTISDDEEQHVTAGEEFETISDRGDSVSNASEPFQENLNKLREDYGTLARDVELIREEFRSEIQILKDSLEALDKQNRMITELIKRTGTQAMDREDAISEKLDSFHFTLSERMSECEERLEQYNNQMTTFEKRFVDEGERMSTPDFAVRGRDAISSVITFSLSLLSFILFIFTAIVDAIRLISENNAIATSLSLLLFGVIVGLYHYLGLGKT